MLIRYYGSCGLLNGYGQAANEMVLALTAAADKRVQIEARSLNPAGEQLRFYEGYERVGARVRDDASLSPNPDVVIIHAQPLDAPRVLDAIRPSLEGHRPRTIVYTTWEGASAVPRQIINALAHFDQVWVPSTQNRNAILRGGWGAPNLVHVIPHAFDEGSLVERRRERPSPQRFRFYYLGHWNGRKNVPGLIRAWARAFSAADDVELAIHSTGAQHGDFVVAANSVGAGVRDDLARIVLTNHEMSHEEVIDFHRRGDCFVTATRGEAWNLPAFDAVLAGRMVIHPAGMGTEEYLEACSSLVVQNFLQPACDDVAIGPSSAEGMAKLVFSGAQGVTARTDWFEPELNHLAYCMRKAFETRRRTLEIDYNLERFGHLAVGAHALKAIAGDL